MPKAHWSMIIVIVMTAVLAYSIAFLLGEPVHWFLLIILVAAGLFIQTTILILQTDSEQKATDTHLKGRA